MANKIILLDIDGVLVTTPGWKRQEFLADGFSAFNERAAKNLAHIIARTSAHIILTTSHRHSYPLQEWATMLSARGIGTHNISTIDTLIADTDKISRVEEISRWINEFGSGENYVIIDDDTSLDSLPANLKCKWVKTLPLIGLDEAATLKALAILNGTAV